MSKTELGRRSVLLVEDDQTFSAYLVARLERAGYQVETAPDGMRALFSLRRQAPDLMIVDLALPGLDGLSLLEKLRVEQLGVGVPIIILTGRYSAADVERAAALGVQNYVVKPFDDAAFMDTLAFHLGGATSTSDDWLILFNR